LGVVFYVGLASLTSSYLFSPLFFRTTVLGGGFLAKPWRQTKPPPPLRTIVPKNKGEQGEE